MKPKKKTEMVKYFVKKLFLSEPPPHAIKMGHDGQFSEFQSIELHKL